MSRERRLLRTPSRITSLRAPLAGALMALVIGMGIGHGNASATAEFSSSLAWMLNAYDLSTSPHQHVSYEDGEESVYSQASSDEALSTTTQIVRVGSQAGSVILRPDDPQYRGDLGYRAEWQSSIYAEAGREYAYGASYYLPDDWDQGENPKTFDDRIIFQFHEGDGPPIFSLHLDAEDDEFFLRRKDSDGDFEKLWRTDIETETWHDFAFRVRWSKDSDGFFQVYLDGRLQYQFTGETLNGSNRIYTKWGIYGQPTRLIVDEVSIIEGPEGLFDATPANLATVMNEIPSSGVTLVRFSGGGTDDLVASSGCPDSAMFWFTVDGDLVWYNPVAPDFVNQRWNSLFQGQLPRNTLLIATCDGS